MSEKISAAYKDKIIIVTGGAGGIGRAVCLLLGEYGKEVIVTGRRPELCEAVAHEIRNNQGKAEAVQLDSTQSDDVRQAIDRTVLKYGRIDYIFNNAGISVGGEMRDLRAEDWLRVMDVNFNGTLYGTVAARIMW